MAVSGTTEDAFCHPQASKNALFPPPLPSLVSLVPRPRQRGWGARSGEASGNEHQERCVGAAERPGALTIVTKADTFPGGPKVGADHQVVRPPPAGAGGLNGSGATMC